MPRALFIVSLLLFCAQRAVGHLEPQPTGVTGPYIAQLSASDGGATQIGPLLAAGTTTSYLDWSGTGTLASAGSLQALLPTGTMSLNGDDAHMNTTGLLGTMGFSIANTNAAGGPGLSEVDGELDFFRQSDSSFLGGVTFTANLTTILGAPLAAQSSIRLSFADGSLEAANIILNTPDIFITTDFTNSVNTLDAVDSNVGIQIRNPAGGTAAPGASSQDKMILNGNAVASPFGGNPVGNTSYFTRVSPVPEPAMLGLITVGAALCLRRR